MIDRPHLAMGFWLGLGLLLAVLVYGLVSGVIRKAV